jgi:hypothetical protein
LLAVGLEGLWGLVISAVALPVLTVVTGSDGLPLDSVTQALRVGIYAFLRPVLVYPWSGFT